MGFGKLGQAVTAREVFELVRDDLERVEKEISRESVASVDAITAIGQYLRKRAGSGCGLPCCCFPPNSSAMAARARSGWARSSRCFMRPRWCTTT